MKETAPFLEWKINASQTFFSFLHSREGNDRSPSEESPSRPVSSRYNAYFPFQRTCRGPRPCLTTFYVLLCGVVIPHPVCKLEDNLLPQPLSASCDRLLHPTLQSSDRYHLKAMNVHAFLMQCHMFRFLNLKLSCIIYFLCRLHESKQNSGKCHEPCAVGVWNG
jgi:hypothetical protein